MNGEVSCGIRLSAAVSLKLTGGRRSSSRRRFVEAAVRKFPSEIILRPAVDAQFALLDGRSVLFSGARQEIYELDKVGAFVWCSLAQNASLEDIYRGLGKFGISEGIACQFANQAIGAWLDRALLDVDWGASNDYSLSAILDRRRISIYAANRGLLEKLVCLFCALDDGASDDDLAIKVVELGGQVIFRGDDASVHRCEIEALAPTIKAYITERLIRSHRSAFALHAASLTRDGGGLLLCGEPGAGKSTLTLRLLDAGFRYAGDDVALIGVDGTISGIPFALTLKQGAWGLFSRLQADGPTATSRRSDGTLVRYTPVADLCNATLSANWVIFLNRITGGPAKLRALDQLESMKRLIESAFAVDGKLSQAGFSALKRIVAGASSFELTYCESMEARRIILDLCDGRA
ncbi:serine/threonine protein kinase [Bradyrhizobium sp. LTSP849]|uniref:serine/threonine protein kinase n=1 Tax=Bradyrhizobium sp. LTSP849 TaxID=1615890 RepID=UPI001FD9EBCF|nr:serine/threonine protein kinase [Bradyrhizobium sp. LTSP849]